MKINFEYFKKLKEISEIFLNKRRMEFDGVDKDGHYLDLLAMCC